MKFVQPPRRPGSEDHLIPLINIVFLLLIFFMLAGRIAPTDVFEVKPPASASEDAPQPEVIKVLVGVDGEPAVDGEVVTAAALAGKVAAKLDAAKAAGAGADPRPPPVITLKADANIKAQQLSLALNALRAAGSTKVTLLTARGR